MIWKREQEKESNMIPSCKIFWSLLQIPQEGSLLVSPLGSELVGVEKQAR